VLYTFLVATILIALAELGDKTQLLALVLATRFKAWEVMVGIFGATLLVHLISTALGAAIGSLIPVGALTWVAGLLFVGFGIWTLRGEEAAQGDRAPRTTLSPILASAVAFFLAELGDKTQLMTMAIAADPGAALRSFGGFASKWLPAHAAAPTGVSALVGVWTGSTLGMLIADGIAIFVGAVLCKTLPERLITRVSGVLFIMFGVGVIAAMLFGHAR
jgi:putative Ca2+/H+ antiporter (TMEM165/GDT1 family)